MAGASITVPLEEYELIRKKAELFDQFVESDALSKAELARIKKALKGPFLTKPEFLKRFPHLS